MIFVLTYKSIAVYKLKRWCNSKTLLHPSLIYRHMFDRESFKEVFDFTDEEVDEFLEVAAGEKMEDADDNTNKVTAD